MGRARRSDPGLLPTELRTPEGEPFVGARPAPIRRFASDPALERVLRELRRGLGPSRWWPARTPFEVVVGAVLVQNTAWGNVERALSALRARDLLDPEALVATPADELALLVRPSGTYRSKAAGLHAVSRWYLDAGGLRPLRERPLEPLRDELLSVHGVGPETADAILCFAAGRRTPVVGAYTRRVLARHGLLAADASYAEARAWLAARLARSLLVHQELHALCVRTGYEHCKPTPRCETCPATAPPG